MKTILFFLAAAIGLFTSIASAESEKTYGDIIVAEVTSIYDGDTFKVNLEGYPPIIGERIGVRVYGIDTPEMKDNRPTIKALAQKAKQFTVAKLRSGKQIVLKNARRGKYFRIVAEVWIDGRSLGDELIAAGLAKPYFGDKKVKWE